MGALFTTGYVSRDEAEGRDPEAAPYDAVGEEGGVEREGDVDQHVVH